MNKNYTVIRLDSWDKYRIRESIRRFRATNSTINGIPSKSKLFTLIRSPHIDKCSRVQYNLTPKIQILHLSPCADNKRRITTPLGLFLDLHPLKGVRIRYSSYSGGYNTLKFK